MIATVYSRESTGQGRRRGRMQTIQFLLALAIGGWVGGSGSGLGHAVAWTLGVSFILSLVTSVIAGAGLPRSQQSPYGVTIPRGLFAYLFFGTITTMAIAAVVTALLFGGAR